jgi:6-phosphogluconolactonase
MPAPDIQVIPSPAELARFAAASWLDQLADRTDDSPYSVALSGGRITKAFFQSIVEQSAGTTAAFDKVHFFWADERCVPPDDPESNFRMADELLFQPLGIAQKNIHRIHGELPPQDAAAAARVDLERFHHLKGTSRPLFDMIFLGMGEDGHIASLFPGESEETKSDEASYRSVVAVKPPPNRVTLGYGAIESATSVTALVSGTGKESALREALAPDGKNPMARIIQHRDSVRILTDMEIETN